MGKFYGSIGYAETVETSSGVWVEQITERKYYGDVNRDSRRLQSANQLNDNINVSIRVWHDRVPNADASPSLASDELNIS